ncbi:MAG: HAD family phosphatase [Burkholderiaceae bacterium]
MEVPTPNESRTPNDPEMRNPEALLFDLGGVLVDIDFGQALRSWAAHSSLSLDELQRRFRFDAAYERHERGEIDGREYFMHLAESLELSGPIERIEAGWNAIFSGEFVATRRLVQRVRGRLPCFVFSNTNASHMSTWSRLYPEMVDSFDQIFVSHRLGLRKPDPLAFLEVCRLAGIRPDAMLFFDDLPANVRAAQAVGLQAVRVRSPADVAEALEACGVNAGG